MINFSMSMPNSYFSTLSFRQKCRWIAHFLKAKYRHKERKRSLMLASFVEEGSTIIDVGANVGLLTKEFALAHNRNINVIAFEPGDYCLSILRSVVGNLDNVEIVEAGVGEEDTTNTLKTPVKNAGSMGIGLSQIGGELEREHVSQEVKVMKLDTFYRKNKGLKIGLLKVDVEGGEFNVVKGANDLIEEHKPIWYMEIEERWTDKYGYKPVDLFNYMFERGYSAYSVSLSGELRQLHAYEYAGDYLFKVDK